MNEDRMRLGVASRLIAMIKLVILTISDLLLVDGDPIANINLVADPTKNFVVIMKDGKVYKNILSR